MKSSKIKRIVAGISSAMCALSAVGNLTAGAYSYKTTYDTYRVYADLTSASGSAKISSYAGLSDVILPPPLRLI